MTAPLDLTITRDRIGGTPRRVSFTASATGYVDGTDGVDVPPNSTRMRCRVYRTSNQSIPDVTATNINYDNEAFSVGGMHDNVTNNTRITITTGGDSGLWIIKFMGQWAANVTGTRILRIKKNGSTVLAYDIKQAPPGVTDIISQMVVAYDDSPAVGDYYEGDAFQASGGNLGFKSDSSGAFEAIHVW